LTAEIKDEIEIEYVWPERANLLWKVLEQMYSSSNSQRSSSSVSEDISPSSINIDQGQEEQSHIQEEKVESVSLEKLDCPVSQTKVSNFGRIEITLAEEEDCSTSSPDDNGDDDDNDDKYDHEELLSDFQKRISKHMKLQKRHGDLLYSHKELIDSYALLEVTHEVMVTMVKDFQPHTCTCVPHFIDLSYANSCDSQAKPSCDEHVLVETCDSLIASENDKLKRENEMLKMELSRLKVKGHV
jgi:hypothetical protein